MGLYGDENTPKRLKVACSTTEGQGPFAGAVEQPLGFVGPTKDEKPKPEAMLTTGFLGFCQGLWFKGLTQIQGLEIESFKTV